MIIAILLPEVAETRIITDYVESFLTGNLLLKIDVLTYGYKGAVGLADLNSKLPLKVVAIRTRGKFSWIELEDSSIIGYGLGMSGNIRIEPTPEYLAQRSKGETASEYLKHAHLKICYQQPDGSLGHFYYHDVRRFGRWTYMTRSELNRKLRDLGTDILQEVLPDKTIIDMFRKYNKKNICKVLMDQSTLAGVGAYIKAEILYSARIWPFADVRNIPDESLIDLYHAACDIAKRAYTSGGASLYTFTGLHGDRSDFKKELIVYGKPTDSLGNSVTRTSDEKSPDGRATHWVPVVQTIGAPAIVSTKLTLETGSKTKIKLKLAPKT